LKADLADQNVDVCLGSEAARIDPSKKEVVSANGDRYAYGHFFNAAGLQADQIAAFFGIAHYTMLPFKGIYYQLDRNSGIEVRRLIYPVPDLRMPFLGVHFTPALDGTVYLGPTAVPALGRENYHGLEGASFADAVSMMAHLGAQYLRGRDGIRAYVHEEAFRFFKPRFAQAAQALVPRLRQRHLLSCGKTGIRAQLFDTRKGELGMDFLVQRMESSTHILNAVSPAFTSSFAFARFVLDGHPLR
jgi:L-2-hydroxyglutarate oxidase LhgO